MNKLNLPWLPVLFALVSIISILVGMRLQSALVLDKYVISGPKADQEAIFQSTQHITSKYYGELDNKEFTDKVINAMVAELDPYSHYFHKQNNETYNRYINGLYRGVGIRFNRVVDTTFISQIIPNSPAEEAGLERGDIIKAIEGVDVTGLDLDSILSLSRQRIGEKLSIEILKDQRRRQLQVELQISDLEIPMVLDYKIQSEYEGQDISYVKLRRFDNDIFRNFMETIESHHNGSNKIDKLILDLRDNPGGLVEESVKILNQIFDIKDQLILSTKNSMGKNKIYKSNGRNFVKFDRIVVLCNENTASASEIVAGVLQDYDKAILIGTNTFGKGLIQQNYALANEGSLSLSIGEYILPSGRTIYHSSGDSVRNFMSLVNNRTLTNIKGVEADIQMKLCDLSNVQKTQLAQIVLKNRLWDKMPAESFLFAQTETKENIESNTELCIGDRINSMRWTLCQEIVEAGSIITQYDVDGLILKAVELLNSESYNEILGD